MINNQKQVFEKFRNVLTFSHSEGLGRNKVSERKEKKTVLATFDINSSTGLFRRHTSKYLKINNVSKEISTTDDFEVEKNKLRKCKEILKQRSLDSPSCFLVCPRKPGTQ